MTTGTAASTTRLSWEADPIEHCYEQGWTDGLPVVPPTGDRVNAMLSAVDREPREVLGVLLPIGGEVTVEKAAINAVMAGCRPEYFPVVVTAVECIAQRERSISGLLGEAPLLIVNGPAVKKLNFNPGIGVFGPGCRANATVGRAVSLIMRNLASGPPGQFDMATQTHPGKLSSCIAEFEDASPWAPLHVERGHNADDSALTVVGALGPHQMADLVSTTAKDLMTTLADGMSIMGTYNIYWGGEVLVVMCPTHARLLAGEGWSKEDAKYYLWENARKPVGKLKRGGCYRFGGVMGWPKWIDTQDDNSMVPAAFRPQDIIIMVAGGEVGSYSSIVFCSGMRSITRTVQI